jgi:hypothetical protein
VQNGDGQPGPHREASGVQLPKRFSQTQLSSVRLVPGRHKGKHTPWHRSVPGGHGTAVAVAVGSGVSVGLGVGVVVGVGDGVSVGVRVGVRVAVVVGVGVGVDVRIAVGLGVRVGVGVAVGDGVTVGDGVAVFDGDLVGVPVRVGVPVAFDRQPQTSSSKNCPCGQRVETHRPSQSRLPVGHSHLQVDRLRILPSWHVMHWPLHSWLLPCRFFGPQV